MYRENKKKKLFSKITIYMLYLLQMHVTKKKKVKYRQFKQHA